MTQSILSILYYILYILYIIGWLVILKGIKHLFCAVYEVFCKGHNWIERYGEDSWAVVTGATDGIGWEFCRDIARRGLNVVLISRTEKKLQDRCEALMKEFPKIKADYISADFSKETSAEFYEEIGVKLEKKDVSILVNNVGAFCTKIQRASKEDLRNAVVLNVLPGILLTKVLIEKLSNREKRSGIINVGSVAGKGPNPRMGPYHATKTLCSHFFIGEADNYKDKIDILSAFPGYVTTKMVSKRKVDMVTCTAEECVQSLCRLLGVVNQTFGHWKHQIFARSCLFLKWLFGWKFNMTVAYGILNTVRYLQYTTGM